MVSKRLILAVVVACVSASTLVVSCTRHDAGVGTQGTTLVSTLDDGGLGTTSTANSQQQEPSGDFVNDRVLVGGITSLERRGSGGSYRTISVTHFRANAIFWGRISSTAARVRPSPFRSTRRYRQVLMEARNGSGLPIPRCVPLAKEL